jgi:hypothetical protein
MISPFFNDDDDDDVVCPSKHTVLFMLPLRHKGLSLSTKQTPFFLKEESLCLCVFRTFEMMMQMKGREGQIEVRE